VKRIPARFARVLLLCLLFPAAALVIGASAAGEESKALRVCADPDNLPFSDRQEQGFENRIAALVAEDMGVPVSYFWWPHRRGFLRNTIRANECDVLMGVPEGMDAVLATRPYYRSAFQFVTRVDRDLDLGSLDDPRLRQLKIGVNMIGYEYNNSPAARALGARGIVGLVGFPTFYNEENRPAGIVEAVTEGKIDVAIVWGPVAGYFAKQQEVPLALAPLPDVDVRTRTPFAFSFVVGVRKSEKALAERIQQALDHKQEDIQKILREYGVPIGAPAAAPRGRKHTDAAGPAPAGTLAVASHEEQHADNLLATPDEYQGDLLGDINRRRGKIVNIEAKDTSTVLSAEVPLAEMFGYATAIRSLSKGRAAYSMEPFRFEPVPANIVTTILDSAKAKPAARA